MLKYSLKIKLKNLEKEEFLGILRKTKIFQEKRNFVEIEILNFKKFRGSKSNIKENNTHTHKKKKTKTIKKRQNNQKERKDKTIKNKNQQKIK